MFHFAESENSIAPTPIAVFSSPLNTLRNDRQPTTMIHREIRLLVFKVCFIITGLTMLLMVMVAVQ